MFILEENGGELVHKNARFAIIYFKFHATDDDVYHPEAYTHWFGEGYQIGIGDVSHNSLIWPLVIRLVESVILTASFNVIG